MIDKIAVAFLCQAIVLECFVECLLLRSAVASLMPPKSQVASLTAYQPTPEELEAARALLANCDEGAKKSKMQAMTNYVKKTADLPGHQNILAARGEERQEALLRYLSFQNKKSQKKTTSVKSSENVNAKMNDVLPMTEHEMRVRFGDLKVQHWLDSKVVPFEPDRFTGSTEPAFREYQIPMSWTRGEQRDTDGVVLNAEEQGADEELLDQVRKAGNGQTTTSSSGSSSTSTSASTSTPVKKEKEEPEDTPGEQPRVSDQMKEKVKELVNNPAIQLSELQQATLEAKTMYGEALKARWGGPYAEALLQHTRRMDRSIIVVNKMLMGSVPKEGCLPKLVSVIAKQLLQHADYKLAGKNNFGISIPAFGPKNTKREPSGQNPASKRTRENPKPKASAKKAPRHSVVSAPRHIE